MLSGTFLAVPERPRTLFSKITNYFLSENEIFREAKGLLLPLVVQNDLLIVGRLSAATTDVVMIVRCSHASAGPLLQTCSNRL